MRPRSLRLAPLAAVAALGVLTAYARAEQGATHHHGPMGAGMGPGMMMGMMHGDATEAEHHEIHAMFMFHTLIKRTVTNLPDGIRTLTESDDPEMARIIVSHVSGMGTRVKENRDPKLPIQSPTLQDIFRNRAKIETRYEPTEKGIVVVQTSKDAETVAALQKHAAEVSDLAQNGMMAVHERMMGDAGGMMHMMHMMMGGGEPHRH